MYGVIDGYNFGEMECQRYYAPPATWSDEKKRDNARTKIFSGDFLGAEKKDGYFSKLIKDEDGTIILYSRSRGVNGKFADKHEWVPHLNPLFEFLPNGSCLLGELYFPSAPGSRNVTTIMGCLKEKAIQRQDVGDKLHFYAFDVLAWNNKNLIQTPFGARVNVLDAISRNFQPAYYVEFAEFKKGKELWTLLQEILGQDKEGIVITHAAALYEPGKRPSKTTLKIKKELKHTIDCFFTGIGSAPTREYTGKEIETWQYWENLRTGERVQGEYYKDYHLGASLIPVTKGYFYGWCGSLQIAVFRDSPGVRCKVNDVVYEDKEIFPIGWLSGLTDEMKANPKEYAFIPIEVTAMEYDAFNHTLRHGKMVGWRKDLALSECDLSKIEG